MPDTAENSPAPDPQATARLAAAREILTVIRQSRSDEAPVFEAILRHAAELCNAQMAGLNILNAAGDCLTMMAHHGEKLRSLVVGETVWPLAEGSIPARCVLEARVLHYPDLADTTKYRSGDPVRVHSVDKEGIRTFLVVPLLAEEGAIGSIALYRRNVQPFTDDQIALIESYAELAVIAIENVRQFRELQERLERERTSAEVLKLISQSRDDERPVFDAILEKATTVCQADQASMFLVNEARTHIRLVSDGGHDVPSFPPGTEWPIDQPLSISETLRTGKLAHIHDYAESELYKSGDSFAVRIVDVEGIRTRLTIPLQKDGTTIGVIGLSRRTVRPFSEADIQLVKTFAAQAVIAIENARQFRELQTRLEREAATREILHIISQSRDDETPVFRAILDRAERLCHATGSGLQMVNEARTHLLMMASMGEDNGAFPVGYTFALSEPLGMCQAIHEARVVHIKDLKDSDLYRQGHPGRVALVDVEGTRTHLNVPLLKDGVAFGNITLGRKEASPFSPDEIALVETFADQAVIAIENVRQFREVQERLARERASSEILGVISENREDDRPVFDAILRNACALCNAPLAGLILGTAQDEAQTLAAHVGMFPAAIELFETGQMKMDPDLSYAARSIVEGKLIAFDDMGQSALYEAGSPVVRSMVDTSDIRSVLFVPLMRDGAAIGNITLFRREVSPFDPSEIALVETFAAQAVIAIENVRQFRALETLNAELGDRVTEQVGEIERMGRLKRFLPAAVADTVISQGSEKMLESHRALLGVLFCDIRGFTAFCETAEPEETIEVLQTYHEEMGKLISAHVAGVDHRMGDGIMVLFNDPLPCDDPAGDALRLGLAMQEKMAELCRGWKRLGHKLGFGVGISLGYATVGMVGSEGRYDYTANGTAVNLAARLCDQAEDGEILLSPRAHTAVEDDCDAELHGELKLKGISAPVEVFRVVRAG